MVIDCSLEKYCKTMWTNQEKVAFKICGVSHTSNGVALFNKPATLGLSPSKKFLCKLHQNISNIVVLKILISFSSRKSW